MRVIVRVFVWCWLVFVVCDLLCVVCCCCLRWDVVVVCGNWLSLCCWLLVVDRSLLVVVCGALLFFWFVGSFRVLDVV